MPSSAKRYISLDIGERRIGVAVGDGAVRIASPHTTIQVDGSEGDRILQLIAEQGADMVVVGYPRNQQGEETAQTEYVKRFVDGLNDDLPVPVVFQDESLTSVAAEERLKAHRKQYAKEDIDAYAAAIILNDFLESNHAGQ